MNRDQAYVLVRQTFTDAFDKNRFSNFSQNLLVYYEHTEYIHSAIQYEKRLKKWNHQWKISLIERSNPEWQDLYLELTGAMDSRPRFREDRPARE